MRTELFELKGTFCTYYSRKIILHAVIIILKKLQTSIVFFHTWQAEVKHIDRNVHRFLAAAVKFQKSTSPKSRGEIRRRDVRKKEKKNVNACLQYDELVKSIATRSRLSKNFAMHRLALGRELTIHQISPAPERAAINYSARFFPRREWYRRDDAKIKAIMTSGIILR